MKNYDVIIVGAGSIGVPTAMALGEMGLKTLVLDKYASPGQGENKRALGGIRATHSDSAKILICLRSLQIISTWEEEYGDNIEWIQGGYTFPVYRKTEEKILKNLLPIQKKYGLNIDFAGPDKIQDIIPGINPKGLLGGTFSPEDGLASPLLSINAFYRKGLEHGADFHFKEAANRIITTKGKVLGVATNKKKYNAPVVVDAAGPYSKDLAKTATEIFLPVEPDSHEAAITEPVQPFFKCMVVDIRPNRGSQNYYCYQNKHGQVLLNITPDPPIVGTDKRETSAFLPQACARMVKLIPRLKNVRVRRVWRGLYPMTPDGSPLIGWNREIKGLLHATGMCGQGYMLGPGAGELVARMIAGKTNDKDKIILKSFSLNRKFGKKEKLK